MFLFERFYPIYKGKPNFDILVRFMIYSISPQLENNTFTGTLLWERKKNIMLLITEPRPLISVITLFFHYSLGYQLQQLKIFNLYVHCIYITYQCFFCHSFYKHSTKSWPFVHHSCCDITFLIRQFNRLSLYFCTTLNGFIYNNLLS